jgi:hypothetical protein
MYVVANLMNRYSAEDITSEQLHRLKCICVSNSRYAPRR